MVRQVMAVYRRRGRKIRRRRDAGSCFPTPSSSTHVHRILRGVALLWQGSKRCARLVRVGEVLGFSVLLVLGLGVVLLVILLLLEGLLLWVGKVRSVRRGGVREAAQVPAALNVKMMVVVVGWQQRGLQLLLLLLLS